MNSHMLNLMLLLSFFFLIENILFGKILFKNLKIVKLSLNSVPRLILKSLVYWFIVEVGFSILNQKQRFEANLTHQKKKCRFKLKFGTKTNPNILNLIAVFTFPILNWKPSVWANLLNKIKNSQFQLKFRTKTNSVILKLMMVFIFSILNWKHSFRVNLVQKLKKC